MPIEKNDFIKRVSALFDKYEPSEEVLNTLRQIDLTIVVAPSGMGKNTVIDATGLPRVIGETIREPRANNGVMEIDGKEYFFRGNQLDEILRSLGNREYVQIGMGPGRDSFYGSRVKDYPESGPLLIDLMSSQVETIKKLPFRSVQCVCLVSPSYEAWLERLEKRGELTLLESEKRMAEAKESLELALANDECIFITNDNLGEASLVLVDIATGVRPDKDLSDEARLVAMDIVDKL